MSILSYEERLKHAASLESGTDVGARQITVEAVQHVINHAMTVDARTGESGLRPLSDALRDLYRAVNSGIRPMPLDQFQRIVDLSMGPLKNILGNPREMIRRDHVMVPMHALRDMDERSMEWLSYQPGRNLREKIGRRQRALGVVRSPSADTHENRIARRLLDSVARHVRVRIQFSDSFDAYSESTSDVEAGERREPGLHGADIERFDRLARRDLMGSPLDGVRPALRDEANNTLLADANYSRIWRAWRMFRDLEEHESRLWEQVEERALHALFWSYVARLAEHPAFKLSDTICKVRGVELVEVGRGAEALPRVVFFVGEGARSESLSGYGVLRVVELSLDSDGILIRQSELGRHGFQRPQLATQRLWKATFGVSPNSSQRGMPLRLEATKGMKKRRPTVDSYADLSGFKDIVDSMFSDLTWQFKLDRDGLREDEVRGERQSAVGIDFARARPVCVTEDGERSCGVMTYATRFEFGIESDALDELDALWLGGGIEQGFGYGREGLSHIGAMGFLEAGGVREDDDRLALSYFSRALAVDLNLAVGGRVAYAVPDGVEDISLSPLRTEMRGGLGNALPIWRSIAGLFSWQYRLDGFAAAQIKEEDTVLVFDFDGPGLTVTPFVAKYDKGLAQKKGESGGITWERLPPLPSDAHAAQLSWRAIQSYYGRETLKMAMPGLEESAREALVEELRVGGVFESVIYGKGDVWCRVADGWLFLMYDEALLATACDVWAGAFKKEQEFWRAGDSPLMELVEDRRAVSRSGKVLLLAVGHLTRLPGLAATIEEGLRGSIRSSKSSVDTIICAPDDGVAGGAKVFLDLLAAGLPTWKERLPELYTHITSAGAYDEFCLVKGTGIEPVLGKKVTIRLDETLELPAGKIAYRFPLASGRQRRLLGHELVLNSPAFPLNASARVRISIEYQYGLENSYELYVDAVDPEAAGFGRIKARLVKESRVERAESRDVPPFPGRADRDLNALEKRFNDIAHPIFRWEHFEFRESDRKRAEEGIRQLRSIIAGIVSAGCRGQSGAQPVVERIKNSKLIGLLIYLAYGRNENEAGLNFGQVSDVTRRYALNSLGALGPYMSPETYGLVSQSLKKGGVQSFRPVDCVETVGYRLRTQLDFADVDLLMELLGDDSIVYNPAYNHLIAVFAALCWQYDSFVFDFARRYDGGLEILLGFVELYFDRAVYRATRHADGLESAKAKPWIWTWPFLLHVELMLGLLRLRSAEGHGAFASGSLRLRKIAYHLRQLDGVFARAGFDRKSRIQFDVNGKPASLIRASELAYALNAFLHGEEGAALIGIVNVDDDE